MIEGLKPYAEYKESEVPWVGSVPSDWRVERTKWIFRTKKELNVGRRNTNVLSLTLRGVVNNDPDSPEGMVPKDYATYQLFRKHDLVFKLIDLENIRTSRVGLVHEDGIMSSAYVRLAPSKSVNIRFFYFQFFDLYTRAVFNALGAGVRSTLGAADLGELRIAIPPPDEQAAIVRFLDHANRKIDGFIRAKRKLIGLLNEQKQAIIHRAVTRGLHPDVPLKPSGIPWLGDIPKHWDVRPIKHWTKINARTLGEATAASFEFRYIDIGAVRTGRLVAAPEVMRFDRSPSRARRVLVAGDTIISTVRTYLKAVWFAGENPVNLVASTGFAVFSPLASVEPEYLSYVLQDSGFVDQVTGNSVGIAYPAIAESVLARLRIAIPPSRSEQVGIIVAIKDQTGPLNTAISRTEREIALMQEYRTRLTADLVTGKLDVREAAAQLPAPPNDAPAPDEPLEEIETELEETNDASN